MRTPGDPDPAPWRPLGERVKAPTPPRPPEWQPRPDAPHIEQSRDGKLRTNLPTPKD